MIDPIALANNTEYRRASTAGITQEDVAPYASRIQEYLSSPERGSSGYSWQLSEFLDTPELRYRGLPMFFRWLRDSGRSLDPIETPATVSQPVVYATVAQIRAPRDLTAALIAPWRVTFSRWVHEVGMAGAALSSVTQERFDGGDAGQWGSLNYIMAEPYHYSTTMPGFAAWLDEHGQSAPDSVTVEEDKPEGSALPGILGAVPPVDSIDWAYAADLHRREENGTDVDTSSERRDWVRSLTSAQLEPYRVALQAARDDRTARITFPVNHVILEPAQYQVRLPRFAAWLMEHPEHLPTTTPAVPPVDSGRNTVTRTPAFDADMTGTQLGDQLAGNPLALTPVNELFTELATSNHWGGEWQNYMLGGPNEHSWRPRGDGGYRSMLDQFLTWLREPANRSRIPMIEAPNTVGTGTVIPIGPEHPDWARFWGNVRSTADSAGYDSYYRTIAQAMGAPGFNGGTVTLRYTVEVVVHVDDLPSEGGTITPAIDANARRQVQRGMGTIVGTPIIAHTVADATAARF